MDLVDTSPFLEWLDDYLRRTLDSEARLAERAGSTARTVRTWRNGESSRIGLDVVDRFLVAADEPWLLDDLYPLEDSIAA